MSSQNTTSSAYSYSMSTPPDAQIQLVYPVNSPVLSLPAHVHSEYPISYAYDQTMVSQ